MHKLIFCLVCFLLGCASDRSVGNAPQLQETLEAECTSGQMKVCRVIGGNKFKRRYEYCGCLTR